MRDRRLLNSVEYRQHITAQGSGVRDRNRVDLTAVADYRLEEIQS
jgi:hypothetical protein